MNIEIKEYDSYSASELVKCFENKLIGMEVVTLPMGYWAGGRCRVVGLTPDEEAKEIKMQVKRLSDSEEIGVFEDEMVLVEVKP